MRKFRSGFEHGADNHGTRARTTTDLEHASFVDCCTICDVELFQDFLDPRDADHIKTRGLSEARYQHARQTRRQPTRFLRSTRILESDDGNGGTPRGADAPR